MLSWFDLISNVTFFMPSLYDVSWKIYNSGVFKYKPKWILFRVVYLNINKCICMCAWFLTYDQDAWLSTIGGVFSPKWDSKKPHSNIRNIETLFSISIFKRRNVFFSSSSILQRALAYWHILNLQIFYLSWGDKHDRHERSIVYDFKAREYSGIMSLHITRTKRGLA